MHDIKAWILFAKQVALKDGKLKYTWSEIRALVAFFDNGGNMWADFATKDTVKFQLVVSMMALSVFELIEENNKTCTQILSLAEAQHREVKTQVELELQSAKVILETTWDKPWQAKDDRLVRCLSFGYLNVIDERQTKLDQKWRITTIHDKKITQWNSEKSVAIFLEPEHLAKLTG